MKNMALFVLLLHVMVSFILAQDNAEEVRAKLPTCKNPKGNIGEKVITGCKQLVCLRKKKKAYWAESFASSLCCSYQHVGYKIHHNITTSVGRDNCTKVTLHCGGKEGEPQIDILTDHHECPDGSCQEAFEDLTNVATDRFHSIKAVLDAIVNATDRIEGGCNLNDLSTTSTALPLLTSTSTTSEQTTTIADECSCSPCPSCPTNNCENCLFSSTSTTSSPPPEVPGSEMLFLGPGYNKQIPEILSLPSFSYTNCTIPTKNSPQIHYGYVATVLTDGVMICGGYTHGMGGVTNTCNLLNNKGFWLPPPFPSFISMKTKRRYAAAVDFDGGWWVIGGYVGGSYVSTTETFFEHNKTWVPSVDYPLGVYGLCVVKINETHIFGTGGTYSSGDTYIYSKAQGFDQQESIPGGSNHHAACCLFEDKIYVARDGGKHVDYFSLASQTWQKSVFLAPALPVTNNKGELIVIAGSLTFISGSGNKKIFKMVKKVWTRLTYYDWQEVGELKNERSYFKPLRWNVTDCTNRNV